MRLTCHQAPYRNNQCPISSLDRTIYVSELILSYCIIINCIMVKLVLNVINIKDLKSQLIYFYLLNIDLMMMYHTFFKSLKS